MTAKPADVKALLDRYCRAMSETDRETWLECFADDAVQEDDLSNLSAKIKRILDEEARRHGINV